ncbi:transcription elongation factor B polypeptide 3-like isoform X2 [Stegodyphus dumicola]|nr:transcription elongation factor B polypeptide 3-like isoform X2 [Stegodyphus dumicola]
MLKLLLGHWKAHRKRPQLLPENGDIHFEDPSTVNPLYEDSEASADSSLKQTEGSLIAVESSALKTETPDGQNNKGTSDVTALVDVSVPQALNEPAPQDSKESTSPTHEITSPIRLKEPSDNSKNSPDTFINPAELKKSLGNSKNSPDTSVNPDKLGGSSDSSKEVIDTSSKPISVEKATNSPNEVFDGNQNVKSFYQPKATEVSKPSTSQNLPQTSFLHDGQISNTSMNVKKEESSPISVSTNDQKSKKRQQSKLHAASENDRKPRDKSNSKKTNTLENNEHIASQNNTVHTSGSSTKENPSSSNNTKNSPGKERFKVKEDKSPSPPVTESVPETKKKPKFRARAIDELIKKFQGSPHDDEISTKTEISSPKKGFSVTKTEESKTTPIKDSNEENLEKESLSKISSNFHHHHPQNLLLIRKIIKVIWLKIRAPITRDLLK